MRKCKHMSQKQGVQKISLKESIYIMKNKEISEDFLWGGAVAAHQLEGGYDKGGKGISIADVMTAGANGVDRQITEGILPGKN